MHQRKLRQMQNMWFDCKAEELQALPDQPDSKDFYDAVKAVYGPTPPPGITNKCCW